MVSKMPRGFGGRGFWGIGYPGVGYPPYYGEGLSYPYYGW